jgi:hypothetical protein
VNGHDDHHDHEKVTADRRFWRMTTIMMMIAKRTTTNVITMRIMIMIRLKIPGWRRTARCDSAPNPDGSC